MERVKILPTSIFGRAQVFLFLPSIPARAFALEDFQGKHGSAGADPAVDATPARFASPCSIPCSPARSPARPGGRRGSTLALACWG